jgi:hypothetical protein
MKTRFVLLVFLTASFAVAQQVQYASKVIRFSSDLGGKQNGIKRILGIPDAFPQGGPSPNAWAPKDALDGYEYVVVGFDAPQTVRQVAVFENLNAGCTYRIAVDDGSGKFRTVWSRKAGRKTPLYAMSIPADRQYYYNRKRRKIQKAPEVAANPGIEYAVLDEAVPNVVAVRIEWNFALLPGQKQIDAIAVSDSDAPVSVGIHSTSELENLAEAKPVQLGFESVSNPCISCDGQKLYFTVEGDNGGTLYGAKLENGSWSKGVAETGGLNAPDSYNLLELDTPQFILTGGARYGRGTNETGYELLEKKDGKYFSAGQLKIAAYNNYDDSAEAAMTADAAVIVMGIETDFTQGGADLYFAKRKPDGSYGMLENTGKAVNSAADESMPFLLSDQKTLLFCSNGFASCGDFDIFVTTRLDETWKKWSQPINLGHKINGPGFDGSPFYDEKTQTLYFIRATDGKGMLHAVPLPAAWLRP